MKKAKKAKKARAAPALKKTGGLPRSAISSSSPLGMVALHLLQQWRKSGRDGIVFLAGEENRAERLASIVHSLDRSSGVLVFPRLNNLPFDGLEPSREIAGRRSSVLRRLAKAKKPVFLLSTAEAIMERLPLPESLSRLSVVLKVGAKYAEQDLQTRLETLGYDLDEEAEFPGTALFHGKTFEIFPAGALNPFRIEHADEVIRKIVAVDPEEHEVMFEVKELLVDPMFERLALEGKRGQRATLPDYCGRARWIADAGNPWPRRWLAEHDRRGGRSEGSRARVSGARGMEEAGEAHEHAASQGRLRADPRFLEDGGAEKSTPRLYRRYATRQDRGCSLLQRLRRTCARWSA